MRKIMLVLSIAFAVVRCGESSLDPSDAAATRAMTQSSSGDTLGGGPPQILGIASSAWVMTSTMFIDTSLTAIPLNSPQNAVPGWGTTLTSCSSPGAMVATYNPTGPVWCAENAAANPNLCANNNTPQYGIVSVCTRCPSGQWTSAQVSVAVKYFWSTYPTVRCVQ